MKLSFLLAALLTISLTACADSQSDTTQDMSFEDAPLGLETPIEKEAPMDDEAPANDEGPVAEDAPLELETPTDSETL